jgi:hypothetical protein
VKWVALLRDRVVLALVAVAILVTGLFALYLPTALDDYDKWGFRITCGSALSADYEQAATADAHAAGAGDYADQCQSAIWWRRGWASTLVLIGVGLSIALLVSVARSPSSQTAGGSGSRDPAGGR